MAGFGLGFGAHSTARAGRGAPPAGSSALYPGAGWNGAAGSGFGGSPPMDPARVTAKPALRLLVPPNQHFTQDCHVGVIGGANDSGTLLTNLGIERVDFHLEGQTLSVNAPSFRAIVDANGVSRSYFGWWARLAKPAGLSGLAQLYIEAIARDTSMQNRIIGPYIYGLVDARHDFELTVATNAMPSAGSVYNTIGAALSYLAGQNAQNPKITVTQAGIYDLGAGPSGTYGTATGRCLIEATEPITIGKSAFTSDAAALLRTKYDGLHLRGANITIDREFASQIYHEGAGPKHWFDGITVMNSRGRETYWRKGPNVASVARGGGYFTECDIRHVGNAFNGADLVRGCEAAQLYWDVASNASCVVGTRFSDIDQTFFRRDVDAFTLIYSGAEPTATLSASGGNDGKPRFLTVTWGSSSAVFTTDSRADVPADASDFKAWVEALDPGFACTVHDTTRRIAGASLPGNTGGDFSGRDIKSSALLVVTMFDTHGDWYQQFGTEQNVVLYGNIVTDTQTQDIFLTGSDIADFLIVNNAFHNQETREPYVRDDFQFSQFNKAHSHVVLAHNSFATQGVVLRTDQEYDPDSYCLIVGNVMRSMAWNAAADSDLTIAANHISGMLVAPAGATGTSFGGSVSSLFADAPAGNFQPSGALLTYRKPPMVRYDAQGQARRSPLAPAGAARAPAGGDVIAPTILSADPSGSYLEGDLISGALTADETVSWGITGADGEAVTLDPDSGLWSLGLTDYDTQAAYSFAFTAIDPAGNFASQAVAMAIMQAGNGAAILSDATDTASGSNGAVLSVLSDQGNGTVFWYVSTSAAPPASADLAAGTGASASGSQPVTMPGTQTISAGGLAPGSQYYSHFLHRNAAGEDSAVASADGFTTASQTSGAVIMLVAGQSNARKAGTDPAAVPARYTNLANAFNWIAGTGAPAPYVAGTNSGSRGGEGEWGTEAEAIYQLRAAGDTRPVYVVKVAVNGNQLATGSAGDWAPTSNGERFDELELDVGNLRTWLAANTSHTEFEEIMFWNQGENDANFAANASAYPSNWTAFLTAFRSRVSADAYFVAERIRPLPYPYSANDPVGGYARAYLIRESQLAGLLADGNGTSIDTDFDVANFPNIHPFEPDPWNETTSWTTQIGKRAYAAMAGTYASEYGAITDTTPDAFAFPASEGTVGVAITSGAVAITGIERQSPIILPMGVEGRVLNAEDSIAMDFTNTPGFVDKFQKLVLRNTPGAASTVNHTISIGGVTAIWAVTGTSASVTYRGDTQAWLDALTTAGGASLTSAQKAGLDAFYQGRSDDGLTAKIRALVLALGSETANLIRIDNPAILATPGTTNPLPWANGYKATDNGQQVFLNASPSALTTGSSVSLTVIVNELGGTSAYALNSIDSSIGFRINAGGSVRVRLHAGQSSINAGALTKLGPYTVTADGTTARLYDPDGILIGSTAYPAGTPTATKFLIGNSGTTDQGNRIWGAGLSTFLSAAEVTDFHGHIQALRALF